MGSNTGVAATPHNPVVGASPVEGNWHRFQFVGQGGEYFGIWIVNLVLSLLTVGIYSAWAKVRRERYFHRNTLLAGSSFDYHGRPLPILLGRTVILTLLMLLQFSDHLLGPLASLSTYQIVCFNLLIACVFYLAYFWLWTRSLRFRAHNTSWRGLRFHHSGRWSEALRATLPLLGLMLFFFISVFLLITSQVTKTDHDQALAPSQPAVLARAASRYPDALRSTDRQAVAWQAVADQPHSLQLSDDDTVESQPSDDDTAESDFSLPAEDEGEGEGEANRMDEDAQSPWHAPQEEPPPSSQPREVNWENLGWIGVMALLCFLAFLVMPLTMRALLRFRIGKLHYGQTAFQCTPTLGVFLRTFWVAAGVCASVVLLIGIVVIGMLAIRGVEESPGLSVISDLAAPVAIGAFMLAYLAAILILPAYFQTRINNHVWNATALNTLRFRSTMKVWPLVGIYLSNAILLGLTLGLYWPWSRMRLARYRIENLAIEVGNLDDFVAQAQQAVSALGDAAVDFADWDFSW